jgi:hypothetical protein
MRAAKPGLRQSDDALRHTFVVAFFIGTSVLRLKLIDPVTMSATVTTTGPIGPSTVEAAIFHRLA